MAKSLEQKIQELQDRDEIRELTARYCWHVQHSEGEKIAHLFTDDGVMDGDMGTVKGHAALRDAVARVWAAEPAGTLHLTLNAVIDTSGSEPSVESVMLMVASGASPARRLGSRFTRDPGFKAPSVVLAMVSRDTSA